MQKEGRLTQRPALLFCFYLLRYVTDALKVVILQHAILPVVDFVPRLFFSVTVTLLEGTLQV